MFNLALERLSGDLQPLTTYTHTQIRGKLRAYSNMNEVNVTKHVLHTDKFQIKYVRK